MNEALFKPAGPGNCFFNAVVEHQSDATIAMGFADLAELAVEQWKRGGENDLLFVPILYTYRHAFELILKAAIREAAICLRDDGDLDPRLDPATLDEWLAGPKGAGHNLHALAVRVDEWVTRLDFGGLPNDTYAVLLSLHELDRKADSFRYASVWGTSGLEPSPRPGLTNGELQAHVDVVAMHERLRDAFTLICFGLMTELDLVREYQTELAYMADM